MTYLLVGLAALGVIALAAKVVRGRTIVIRAPSLGVLNLAGVGGEELLTKDLRLVAHLFSTTRRSEDGPPPCDVLLLYCDIETTGTVMRSARSLRELIRDSGASIVVVAMNHSVDAYIAAAPQLPFGQANLVMTLDRKGAALPNFLFRLFERMNAGTSMPVAWNELASQIPGTDHADAPETIFACERGPIAFGAAQSAVAADGASPRR